MANADTNGNIRINSQVQGHKGCTADCEKPGVRGNRGNDSLKTVFVAPGTDDVSLVRDSIEILDDGKMYSSIDDVNGNEGSLSCCGLEDIDDLNYHNNLDLYPGGRLRTLSRISEASHTSGEHEFGSRASISGRDQGLLFEHHDVIHNVLDEQPSVNFFVDEDDFETPQNLDLELDNGETGSYPRDLFIGGNMGTDGLAISNNNNSSGGSNNSGLVGISNVAKTEADARLEFHPRFRRRRSSNTSGDSDTSQVSVKYMPAVTSSTSKGDNKTRQPTPISSLNRSEVKRSSLKKKNDKAASSPTAGPNENNGFGFANKKKSISFSDFVHVRDDTEMDSEFSSSPPLPIVRSASISLASDHFHKRGKTAQDVVGDGKVNASRLTSVGNNSGPRHEIGETAKKDLLVSSHSGVVVPVTAESGVGNAGEKKFRPRLSGSIAGSEDLLFIDDVSEAGMNAGELSEREVPSGAVGSSLDAGRTGSDATGVVRVDDVGDIVMSGANSKRIGTPLRSRRNEAMTSNGATTSSGRGYSKDDFVTSDDVFKPLPSSSMDKKGNNSKKPERPPILQEALKNSLIVILSGLYGLFLVVLGFVLPISETFATNDRPLVLEVFYIYLYGVSMVFLIYVYTYLLRKERIDLLSLPKSISRTFTRTFSRSSSSGRSRQYSGERNGPPTPRSPSSKPLLTRQNSTLSTSSVRGRRRKIAFNPANSHHTGSFYLRVGVIAFGIGSMIHSGLTFGHYFEINHLGDPCSNIMQAMKPLGRLCFTFVQMYFVFMNSKMCVHKYKTLARFGLMHMSGTNICVWLRSIVVETLHVIKMEERKTYSKMVDQYKQAQISVTGEPNATKTMQDFEGYYYENSVGSLPELNCHWDAMMGKIVEKSSVYLYPCVIEYSLVCACVLYVMWSNVGEGTKPTKDKPRRSVTDSVTSDADSSEDDDDDNNHHRMSVDCTGSSQGLFLGVFLFVVSVVSLVCFYVLVTTGQVTTATFLGHIAEEVIYILALVATGVAAYRMRGMHFSVRRVAGIEEILTLISLSGLGLFGMFSIVASMFYLNTLDGALTILTNMFMMIQAGAQATFSLAALRASAVNGTQVREKPGRQYVTFLLISNFALWAINTFETQRSEHNLIQVEFYGATAWSIFTHVSVPLGIYFRFHSTVSLSNVWKKAWKMKHAQINADLFENRHGTRGRF